MKNHINNVYNTPYQLKLPLEIERIIEISDPIYMFCEVLNQIDLRRYLEMFKKETEEEKYHNDQYRAVKFPINKSGKPVCTNGIATVKATE